MADIYRTLRVIELVGSLDFINHQKQNDAVKGTKVIPYNGTKPNCYIHSEYIGEPTIIKECLEEDNGDSKG